MMKHDKIHPIPNYAVGFKRQPESPANISEMLTNIGQQIASITHMFPMFEHSPPPRFVVTVNEDYGTFRSPLLLPVRVQIYATPTATNHAVELMRQSGNWQVKIVSRDFPHAPSGHRLAEEPARRVLNSIDFGSLSGRFTYTLGG